jgi:outer membrane lipase/esterase
MGFRFMANQRRREPRPPHQEKPMRTFRRALVASAVALACSAGSASAQFSNFYFFGDSLSDAGTFAPALPPGTGRFTTNPDPVWAQVLGERYGFTITPATSGGTDFAQGGARVALLPGFPGNQPLVKDAIPVTQQVQQALARGVDPGALYVVWAGANDVLTQVSLLASGQTTAAQAQTAVVTAATQVVQQVALLQAAGVQTIAVQNLPDIGKTPGGIAAGPVGAAALSQLSGLFNTTLTTGLNALGGNVIRIDSLTYLNDLLANPASYGITNVTGAACGTTPSLVCTPANLVAPNANLTYAFADGSHPTGATHAILADAVAALIEGPQQLATLTMGPLAVEQATFRAVDARMWSAFDAPPAPKGMNVWASYDFAKPDIDLDSVSGDADLNTFSIGGDLRVTPELMAGAAVHYSSYDASYGGGEHELDEISATIYGGWGHGPWYVGGSLLIGYLDYSDVSRSFSFGSTTRGGSGDTSGTHYAVRALGGYWFKQSNLLHGPFAKLVWQNVSVNGFSESNTSTVALRYADQERDSLIASLGWQVQGTWAGPWGAVRPFGRVTWEYEFKDDALAVTASPSAGGSYTITAGNPDSNWALFNFGASMDFGQPTPSYGRLSGYLMGSATAGKSDGDFWAITVGLRLPM